MPIAVMTPPTQGVKRAQRDCGNVAPSRTAAMGATRVARIAGNTPAIRVMRMPASRLTTIVRPANTSPVFGRSKPIESKSAVKPLASPSPRNRPITEAIVPMTSASRMTDVENLAPGRPDRP